MKRHAPKILACLLLGAVITGGAVTSAAASDDDNSLYSLGLMTDGAVLERDVEYGVFEYDVIVPAGTEELELDPIPTNENATVSYEGTELDADGNGTVLVTVTAPNGDPFTYTIHVTSLDDGEGEAVAAETEAVTEPQTEKKREKPKETEPQTEEKLYVEVPRDTVTQAQNTITELQNEIIEYRENVNLFQKIMYVLLAVAIVFLFIIINMFLRNRDLKAELKEYRSLGYSPSGKDKNQNQGSAGAAAPAPAPETGTRPAAAEPQTTGRQKPSSVYYEKAPLDVTPQTSRRAKKLPGYEAQEETGAPAPAPAPAPAKKEQPAQPRKEAPAPAKKEQPAQTPPSSTSKKDKDGVQVDMIDL